MTDRYDEGDATIGTDLSFAMVPKWLVTADVPHTAVRVYAVLALHADRQTGDAWPGLRRISELAHASLSTTTDAIDKLVAVGAITVKKRNIGGARQANHYRVNKVPHGFQPGDNRVTDTGQGVTRSAPGVSGVGNETRTSPEPEGDLDRSSSPGFAANRPPAAYIPDPQDPEAMRRAADKIKSVKDLIKETPS